MALATLGGLVLLVGIGVCVAAVDVADERTEAQATARAEPVPTATPEIVCPTPEEAAYFEHLETTAKPFADAILEHEKLVEIAASNPAVADDIGWQHDVVATLGDMQHGIDLIRTWDGPVPESVQDIHEEYNQALDMIEQAIVLITDGFKWISIYKVEQGYRIFAEVQPLIRSVAGKKAALCFARLATAEAG